LGGTYSIVAPRVPIESFLTACRDASGSDAVLTWVPKAFLDEHGVEPWSDLPLWIPDYPGLNRFNATRAAAAGFETRSLESTISDTLTWDRGREQTWPMGAGLTSDREAQLLAAWLATV